MTFVNEASKQTMLPKPIMEGFVLLLAPFAPHIAEELWHRLGHPKTLAYEPWPTYDEALTQDEMVEIVLQVNGRVRDKVNIAADASEEEITAAALNSEKVQAEIAGKQVRKTIVVPGKLCNIVVSR